ncbi:MAG: type II toxin-antitoxin system HicA family toxin [Puniceicoccaceae bacterium]|nr:MAG: type II toxin-antitoxin system HicA family toxin [Puniceicoccaceae bacterium]
MRDILKLLAEDGWKVVRSRGSHRQMKHPAKKGTVTVAGKSGLEIPVGTLKSILKQAQLEGKEEK